MSEEHLLKRNMGGFGLLFISIGAMIGSGWLFSALYAAQLAGPAAIISWIIAAFIGGVIALVFAELGAEPLFREPPAAEWILKILSLPEFSSQ